MRALTGEAQPLGRATLTSDDGYRIEAPAGEPAGGFILEFHPSSRRWTGMQTLVFEAEAISPGRIHIEIVHGGGRWTWYFAPKPGLSNLVAVAFRDLVERPPNTSYPGYFTFGGGPEPVDFEDVRSIAFRYDQPGPDVALHVRSFRLAAGPVESAVQNPSVVVDRFGQWIGLGGARRSEREIRAAWDREARTAVPVFGRSQAGGDGSRRLEGTGFFRVDKVKKRWVLVDPQGHPFFSVGPTCVHPYMPGPVEGREFLFEELPDIPVGPVIGKRGAGRYADFYKANLVRRYGQESFDGWARQVETRLVNWGFNTIANWSDPSLCSRGRLPYTDRVRGLDGMCQHVPDVFAPDFEEQVLKAVQDEVKPKASDPALIGFFVGNEPRWTFGGAKKPFQTIFESNEHPHTRADALQWIKERYDDLASLNRSWGTEYRSWDDLVEQGVPDPRTGSESLRKDADDYTGRVLERFYDACAGAVRSVDPNHLLLGARYYTAAMPKSYIKACDVFDVFSFNCYRTEIPYDLVDRVERLAGIPSMIGEFHFGAVENGRSGGIVSVRSQEERGRAYARFVLGAAKHPSVVGAHWFQWVDEPVTGRFDGEDYNAGLVDIQDIPYEPLVAHAIDAHAKLYDAMFTPLREGA